MTLDRRDFMRLVGAGAGAAVLPGSGCGDNLAPDKDGGVAVLEPWGQGFLVAVWAAQGDRAQVIVKKDGVPVAAEEVRLVDGIGAVDITGLDPDGAYEVLTHTRVGTIGPSRVRTAPDDDDDRGVRIAVGADFDPSNPEFDSALVDHVLAADPDVLVTIGDFPYTDNGPVAKTVAEYRRRHIDLRVHPQARKWLEGGSLFAIYDDHEFHNNWNPAFVTAEPERYAAAMQVWDEMFPLRAPVGDVRYRSWRWGANVEGFMLDCRRFRSANDAPDGPDKTMLGAVQLDWIIGALRASTAACKLVFTSVPLDFGNDNDSWIGFAHERGVLLDALVGIPGILFVTADQHYFAAHRHAHGVREFMCGPLARGLGPYGPTGPGVLFRASGFNALLLDVHPDRVEVAGIDADGERFYTESIALADLTPR